ERESQVETDDGLLMVFTSGTTGQPKGALLSHRNIIHSSLIEADTFESTPDDVYLNNMPINHVGGAIVAGSTPIVSASTMVLLAKFSPTKTLQLIEQEGVSVLGQIPTQYTMEFNVPDYDKYDKSSLRVVHFGGSMPPKTTLRKVHASMCENMFNCLGMTEAAGIVSYTPKGASIEVLSKSVGKGIPEVEWKLVDKKRRPVRRGEVGEIAYRGSTIIKEYYKLPQATAEAIDDEGWFYAGDLFYEDENGLLIFMGRKHDMFITGGENVYPAEVEKAISSYEKVQTVAVVPVKDDVYGEIGCAYIIPKPGYTMEEEEITTFLKAKLAKYKIPKKFIFREALPLNATGKVDKKMLKKKIAEEIQALSS
ncbi:MAG TPA: long-chain fatty acid--CoA ligase, partial [Syntrophomonadaceae bacterium]|nr:long-chain fatty acid--CoA ligase [Syntrophomonadaceae bacterium]